MEVDNGPGGDQPYAVPPENDLLAVLAGEAEQAEAERDRDAAAAAAAGKKDDNAGAAAGDNLEEASSEHAEAEMNRRCVGCKPLTEYLGANCPSTSAPATRRHVLYSNENFYFFFR